MDSKYITINEMIDRDLKTKTMDTDKPKQTVYQIQALKGKSDINAVPVGEYSFIPTTKILEMANNKHLCKLLAMVIPESDMALDTKALISFFISRKKKPNKILCKLSYCYISSEKQFAVCIERTSSIETIEKYNEYHGEKESIYLLTQVLLREDVKKKIFN